MGKQGQNKFYINELKNYGRTTDYKARKGNNIIREKEGGLDSVTEWTKKVLFSIWLCIFYACIKYNSSWYSRKLFQIKQ